MSVGPGTPVLVEREIFGFDPEEELVKGDDLTTVTLLESSFLYTYKLRTGLSIGLNIRGMNSRCQGINSITWLYSIVKRCSWTGTSQDKRSSKFPDELPNPLTTIRYSTPLTDVQVTRERG